MDGQISQQNPRVMSLKLLELTQFTWPNLSIYFNFLCAAPLDDVIESPCFLMKPPFNHSTMIVFVWEPYISDWDNEINCFTIIQLHYMFFGDFKILLIKILKLLESESIYIQFMWCFTACILQYIIQITE